MRPHYEARREKLEDKLFYKAMHSSDKLQNIDSDEILHVYRWNIIW